MANCCSEHLTETKNQADCHRGLLGWLGPRHLLNGLQDVRLASEVDW